MVNEMPRHKDRFILFLNRLVSFTSPIDPLVCTPEPFPSGIALPPCLCAPIHRHFRLSRSKNAPATSLLRPSSRSPTSINDYYHLIYVLYAYRGLFGARSAPVASCLLLSDIPIRALNELAQRNTVWRIVADGHGSQTTQYLKSLQSIFGLSSRRPSRSVDAIRTLLLAYPRLFCGVASPRPLSLELICLLRVAPIVDAVKWGCLQSIVHCTRLGDSRSPVGFAEPTHLLGFVIVLARQ